MTGGGYEFVEGSPANTNYIIGASRPSNETTPTSHPAPLDGTKATGWLAYMENSTGSTFKFRLRAMRVDLVRAIQFPVFRQLLQQRGRHLSISTGSPSVPNPEPLLDNCTAEKETI